MSKHDVVGVIIVHDGEKAVGMTLVERSYGWSWDKYVDAFGVKQVEGIDHPVVYIPEANAVWARRRPLSCLFQATKQLVANINGVQLDKDDEDFFDVHPLATESGVGLHHTVRVMQELIEPYNLKVSHIRIMPGIAPKGDLLQWVDVLGMNPLALGDNVTTNEEFAKITGMSLEEATARYHMEYSTEFMRPAVLCAVSGYDKGNTLGHAEYVGPRGKRPGKEPWLQVQVGREVQWAKPPVFGEVEDLAGKELSLWNSLGPNGKPMSDWPSKAYVSPHAHQRPDSLVGSKTVSAIIAPTGERFDCYVCQTRMPREARIGANCCSVCWYSLWKKFDCGECKQKLVKDGKPPTLRGLVRVRAVDGAGNLKPDSEWAIKVHCPHCHEINDLAANKGLKGPYAVVLAITGVKLVA